MMHVHGASYVSNSVDAHGLLECLSCDVETPVHANFNTVREKRADEMHLKTEKPAQVSLRGLSLDGPRVEGLTARTDSSRSSVGRLTPIP
jgi:hypothetical protein